MTLIVAGKRIFLVAELVAIKDVIWSNIS